MSDRRFALLGSGEFEDWHGEVDRMLLEDRVGGVLILPTASAKEGDSVFESWGEKGLEHYGRAGIPATVVDIRTREDASEDPLIELLDTAAMVFFSGGNPWYLAEVLRGTPFWTRLVERLDQGLSYAGCSAGVACLTERTYDSDTDDFEQVFKPGLGFMRGVLFGPHWDMVDNWIPGARDAIAGSIAPGETLIGIDEQTAIVGDGSSWTVHGRSAAHILHDGSWTELRQGDPFELALA